MASSGGAPRASPHGTRPDAGAGFPGVVRNAKASNGSSAVDVGRFHELCRDCLSDGERERLHRALASFMRKKCVSESSAIAAAPLPPLPFTGADSAPFILVLNKSMSACGSQSFNVACSTPPFTLPPNHHLLLLLLCYPPLHGTHLFLTTPFCPPPGLATHVHISCHFHVDLPASCASSWLALSRQRCELNFWWRSALWYRSPTGVTTTCTTAWRPPPLTSAPQAARARRTAPVAATRPR